MARLRVRHAQRRVADAQRFVNVVREPRLVPELPGTPQIRRELREQVVQAVQILFQLPPNFKKDLDRLNDLLTQFPADLRCAWEFRHESWFTDDVYEALRVGNAALCVADTEAGHTPLVATADFGYMRLRDEGYKKKDLEHWAKTVKDLGKGWGDAFIFFKHEESGIGPKLAQEFIRLLE